jgi:hypothetical protein
MKSDVAEAQLLMELLAVGVNPKPLPISWSTEDPFIDITKT